MLIGFMIQCSDDLTKAAFTYYLEDFIPIRYVVMENLREKRNIISFKTFKFALPPKKNAHEEAIK